MENLAIWLQFAGDQLFASESRQSWIFGAVGIACCLASINEERPKKKYVTSLFSVKLVALVRFWSDDLQNFRQLRNDALEAFKMSRFFWSDTTEFPYKSMAIRCSLWLSFRNFRAPKLPGSSNHLWDRKIQNLLILNASNTLFLS